MKSDSVISKSVIGEPVISKPAGEFLGYARRFQDLTVAFDCGYLSEKETRRLGKLCLEVGRMLGEMTSKADQFCQPTENELCEEPLTYTAKTDATFLTDY